MLKQEVCLVTVIQKINVCVWHFQGTFIRPKSSLLPPFIYKTCYLQRW
jgi:hypothetical protein